MGRARSRVVAHQFSTTMGTWSRRPSRRGMPSASCRRIRFQRFKLFVLGSRERMAQSASRTNRVRNIPVSSTTYCSITQGWVMSLTSVGRKQKRSHSVRKRRLRRVRRISGVRVSL